MVKIEEAFIKQLSGEPLKIGLDFIAFMQENGFQFKGKGAKWDESSTNWKLRFKGKIYATILIDQNSHNFGVFCEFDKSFHADNNLRDAILAKVTSCPQEICIHNNHMCKTSITDYEILGTKYDRVCHSPLQFVQPSAKDIDALQKIMLLHKAARLECVKK